MLPTGPSRFRPGGDDGIATVWGLAWLVVLLSLGWLAVMSAGVAAAQHHLDGAADLAALSGAARLQRGGDACAVARQIAAANTADLTDCRIEGNDLVVTVRGSVQLPFGLDGTMRAQARAGP
jgi:secretion/DNA translocation related TadE-like protein